MKEIARLFIFFLVFLSSCNVEDRIIRKNEHIVKKILIAKTTNPQTSPLVGKYVLAFNDGFTYNVKFGVYSCLKIGDTVNFNVFTSMGQEFYELKLNCK